MPMKETDEILQKSTEVNKTTGLTPIQEQVAILMASGESITSISERLNLNRSTIYQWQKKQSFKCFLNQQRKDAKENLRNGLFGLHDSALKAVIDCLKSDNESIKLRTAMYIISRVERQPIGSTDIRDVLKEQSTEDIIENLSSQTKEFDWMKYKRLLQENGLE